LILSTCVFTLYTPAYVPFFTLYTVEASIALSFGAGTLIIFSPPAYSVPAANREIATIF